MRSCKKPGDADKHGRIFDRARQTLAHSSSHQLRGGFSDRVSRYCHGRLYVVFRRGNQRGWQLVAAAHLWTSTAPHTRSTEFLVIRPMAYIHDSSCLVGLQLRCEMVCRMLRWNRMLVHLPLVRVARSLMNSCRLARRDSLVHLLAVRVIG